jgi:hypothetical protein
MTKFGQYYNIDIGSFVQSYNDNIITQIDDDGNSIIMYFFNRIIELMDDLSNQEYYDEDEHEMVENSFDNYFQIIVFLIAKDIDLTIRNKQGLDAYTSALQTYRYVLQNWTGKANDDCDVLIHMIELKLGFRPSTRHLDKVVQNYTDVMDKIAKYM